MADYGYRFRGLKDGWLEWLIVLTMFIVCLMGSNCGEVRK